MKDTLQVIQLAITVAALVGNTFHGFFRKIFSAREGVATDRISVLRGQADLAIGWACAAAFICTAGHSIAIAGRNPTASFLPVVSLAIGALVLLYIVWFAWQANRLERALWSLALASMVILLLGPGGPFNPIDYDRTGLILGAPPSTPYEPPLPYWVALPVLTAIFVAAFVAEYPRVLDFRRGPGPLVAAACILGVVVLSMGSGAALVQDVLNDPSTPPRLDGKPAQWIRSSREQLSPLEMQTLFRKTSEMTLSRSYLSRFFSTVRELGQTNDQDVKQKTSNQDSTKASGEPNSGQQPDAQVIRNQA